MAAPTTTSARAPELEPSQTALNEPSMEDILASIRRIIAEDQSNSLGRGTLGGLTRRSMTTAPVVEEAAAPNLHEAAAEPHAEADPQELVAGVAPQHGYAEPAEAAAPAFEEPAPIHPEPVYQVEEAFAIAAAPDPVAPTEEAPPAVYHAAAESEDDGEGLMSPFVGASISSSFQTLAESVMLQDPDLIERVMRESMRPLLKAWLDDHLPSIVERLVRNEIERVARGGRGRNA